MLEDKFTDLTNLTDAKPSFVCDNCYSEMLPYPKGQIDNLYAGPCYICSKCGLIIDSSLNKMQHEDSIKPIDLSPFPTMEVIPENKGFNKSSSSKPIDPEAEEDERLKQQGWKILQKRVEVKRDY